MAALIEQQVSDILGGISMTNLNDEDPFDGYEPVAGLEHLGRAIVDADGVPSGSPANFEATRGKGPEPVTAEDKDRMVADIASEFAHADAPPEAEHPWAHDNNEPTP